MIPSLLLSERLSVCCLSIIGVYRRYKFSYSFNPVDICSFFPILTNFNKVNRVVWDPFFVILYYLCNFTPYFCHI